jgi:predicted MPP superfamily phosphohydrolase
VPEALDVLVLWVLPLIAATVVIGVGYLAYEARHVRVVRDDLKVGDLPPELDGLRIVFVSDVHAGPWFGHDRMRMLVRLVDSLEPDVLILGGDYVGGRRNGAAIFYAQAPDFSARLAKVAVLGNHDVWEGVADARKGLAAAGFRLLENRGVRVPVGTATLAIAGVDDLYTGSPSVAAAADDVRPDDYAILVSHNPDVFRYMLEGTQPLWDLALGGHTHGGQISLASAGTDSPPQHHRFRSGWFTENGVPTLVSNGVGTVMLPLRFQTPPEVHAITLRAVGSPSTGRAGRQREVV